MLMFSSLRSVIAGEIKEDLMSQQIYSVDASLYELVPLAVLLPKNKEDILRAIHFASTHQIPLTPRGGGTGIAGGCLGNGIIIDTSKYFNRILEINPEQKFARVQPGVLQDDLNKALAPYQLRLGPDTSTGNRATLGGMVGANAAGVHSMKYGNMSESLLEVELCLSNGECIKFSKSNGTEEIFKQIEKLSSRHRTLIERKFPFFQRRASGYNLHALLDHNFPKLIAGSEGTLGIITELKVALQPLPRNVTLTLLPFSSLKECFQALPRLLDMSPFSCELISEEIIEMGKLSPGFKHIATFFPKGPFISVEFEGEESEKKQMQLSSLYPSIPLTNKEKKEDFWSLRKGGLGLLLSRRSFSRAIAFLEDMAVPVERLPFFIERIQNYFHQHQKEIVLYGHLGEGCLHLRPYFNLQKENDVSLMKKMMDDISTFLKEERGVLSSEHGNGLVRSWLHPKMYGEDIYQIFLEVKNVFDPLHLMNPGKITEGQLPNENLRLNPSTPIKEIPTFLNFEREGGFALSVNMCNGNGECRKLDGVMCPSFQAYRDERHSTRARAEVLQSIVYGKIPLTELTDEGIHDVLDFCLECKGCKTECPSQVDMAKIKSEVLYQRQKTYGIPIRNRFFGHIATISNIGSQFPGFSNWLLERSLSKKILFQMGITPKRNLPPLATRRFSSLWKSKKQGKKVILFNDTFTEFYQPEIGLDAAAILEFLGYEVVIPPWTCCGRPLISKGLLPEAQKRALRLIDLLLPYIEQKIPILGLEPSCLFTIKDDYDSLINKDIVKKLSSLCMTWDHFIEKENLIKPTSQQVLIINHCHERASKSSSIHGTPLKMGCCGMAGSFGYENEHYEMSVKIGENSLFPSIRQLPQDTVLIANGFSCRTQIFHGTHRKALHMAQYLKKLLDI